jgi:hypothetical protein
LERACRGLEIPYSDVMEAGVKAIEAKLRRRAKK